MKAIIYTRHSPQRGGDKSASCEVQAAYCEQHASKKKWEVGGIFEDKERSGADKERPGLWAAIKELSPGDVLLVWKHDRLARNVYLTEYIRKAVEVCKARIVAVEGDVEGDTIETKMIRQVLSVFAEYERELIAVRTKLAMQHHQREGRLMGSQAPYGYCIKGDRLVKVEKEQAAIKAVVRLNTTELDPLEIAQKMNKGKHKTRSHRPWCRRDVERILSNLVKS